MNKRTFLPSLLAIFCLFTSVTALAMPVTFEDFEGYPAGKFPSSWRTWPFQRGKATEVYKVEKEGDNKFLRAFDDKNYSVQILKSGDWNSNAHPTFSFKWRARTLPVGAKENDPATNDSACGVYVVMSQARQEMMKYTWSTTLPVGTVYDKNPGKAYIIVKETGPKKLGTWQTVKVNVRDDYKKYFGREMDKDPVAIAILTDGNATNSPASCDYDDFVIE